MVKLRPRSRALLQLVIGSCSLIDHEVVGLLGLDRLFLIDEVNL